MNSKPDKLAKTKCNRQERDKIIAQKLKVWARHRGLALERVSEVWDRKTKCAMSKAKAELAEKQQKALQSLLAAYSQDADDGEGSYCQQDSGSPPVLWTPRMEQKLLGLWRQGTRAETIAAELSAMSNQSIRPIGVLIKYKQMFAERQAS